MRQQGAIERSVLFGRYILLERPPSLPSFVVILSEAESRDLSTVRHRLARGL